MEFMDIALVEAGKAEGEIPVGAVIVKNGEIIAKAHNTVERDKDVTCHAEILAIRQAQKILNTRRLYNCEMYVTLEPCPMCGWAIVQSGITNLYFGSYDINYGAFSTKLNLNKLANSKLNIYGGIKETECNNLINTFFKKLRL